MIENRKRSMLKTITWRVIASIITMALVFIFTGELKLTATVGAFDLIFKMLFYYIHERTWVKILWGTEKI